MDKDTSPLISRDGTARKGNNAFCLYLERYHLSVEAVARMAGVPMITVWRITQGEPVGSDKAARVRRGLYQLTTVPYAGAMVTLFEGHLGPDAHKGHHYISPDPSTPTRRHAEVRGERGQLRCSDAPCGHQACGVGIRRVGWAPGVWDGHQACGPM